MKKIPSVLFIVVFLLVGHRASGQVDTTTPCGVLFSDGYEYESAGIEPQGYDTLRDLLEWCPFWTDTENHAWDAFSLIGGAAEGWIADGNGSWPTFLSFLKQVLWLNPDTNWYCNDVNIMLTAVQNNKGAEEAICRYILENNKCSEFTANFVTINKSAALGRHLAWLDSVQNKYEYLDYPPSELGILKMDDSIKADTLAHPYDTTIPTLWQDSLETLMGPNASVQTPLPLTSQALLTAQLLENPMKDEIDVSYDMGRTALVTMELRDVLGRSVPIANAKYQLEQPGDHTASLPAPNLPQGIYYLRITTDVGDAITLKVVKE